MFNEFDVIETELTQLELVLTRAAVEEMSAMFAGVMTSARINQRIYGMSEGAQFDVDQLKRAEMMGDVANGLRNEWLTISHEMNRALRLPDRWGIITIQLYRRQCAMVVRAIESLLPQVERSPLYGEQSEFDVLVSAMAHFIV